MFNPVTLSTPFTPSQLGRYNGLQYFFGGSPNLIPSIRPIGDLDNDGYDDLVVGDNFEFNTLLVYGYAPGMTYSSGGFTSSFPESVAIDFYRLSPLFFDNKPFFRNYDSTGLTFEIGQDINGDGFKEVFVSNLGLPIERQNYVLFGTAGGLSFSDIFFDPIDVGKGFYHPPLNNRNASISFDGDVNGDGIIDLSLNDFIFFGTKDTFPGFITSNLLNGRNGFQVQNGISSVFSISNVGDLNGDRQSDLNIGGNEILFSPASFPKTIDVGVSTPGLTTELIPQLLTQIRPLGDVNQDGFDDFAFVKADPWSPTSGKTGLFYGKGQPFNLQIDAQREADVSFNFGVYDASDFNNDGFVDLLMSLSSPPGHRFRGGTSTYISFGGVNGWSNPELIGSNFGLKAGENIGDFNGDGIDDIYLDNKIIFGGRLIRQLTDEEVDGKNGITIGVGFSSVGDVNGDSRTDLAKDGYVIFGTDRINNKDTIVSKNIGGVYNHFEFPDFNYTNADALSFTASTAPNDWVYGGWGNDTLTGRSGQMDQFSGGPGSDQFVLNNEYGLQIGRGFAAIWDFDKGIDKVVVHGTANDYFFVEDNNTWLDNSNATFLRHRSTDTSATVNTILARRCNCEFGAVLIGAFSDVRLDISDLVFVPNTTVI